MQRAKITRQKVQTKAKAIRQRRPLDRKYRTRRKLIAREDHQTENIDQGESYSSEKINKLKVQTKAKTVLCHRRPPDRKYRPRRNLFVREVNQTKSIDHIESCSSEDHQTKSKDQSESYSSVKTNRQKVQTKAKAIRQRRPPDRKFRPSRKPFFRKDHQTESVAKAKAIRQRKPPDRKYRPRRKLFVRKDHQTESIDHGESYSSEKTSRDRK